MDTLTAIPAATLALNQANPNATVAQQVAGSAQNNTSGGPSTNLTPAQYTAITGNAPTTTPTVVSDANIRENTIPDITQRASAALKNVGGVIQAPAPDGALQSANGNYIDKAGNQYSAPPAAIGTPNGSEPKPVTAAATSGGSTGTHAASSTATAAPENEYDAFLKSLFDTNPSTAANGAAPANDPYLTTLATMRATSDAASKTLIDATIQQFASRKAQLGATQAAQHAGLMQALISSGNARYAPILAGQTMTADETAGVLALSSIDAEQSSAVAQLQKAQADSDFQVMGKALDHLDNLQTQKINVASKLADNAAAATKAINDAKAKVTDEVNSVAQDVAKTPGVPASIVAAVAAAPDKAAAINAAGEWLQTATGDAGDYLAYKRDAAAAGQNPVSFQSWQNANAYNKAFATAKGTAAGKSAGEGTGSGTSGTMQDSISSKADIPSAVRAYARQSVNGTWYLDLSGVSSTSRAGLIEKAGDLPVITNANEGLDLVNIQDVGGKLKTIANIMRDLGNSSALSRDLGGAGLSALSAIAQTDPKKAAAQALNDSALDILKAISGVQGFRGNQSAIQAVKDSLPKITDTQDTMASKLSFIAQQIQDRETAILGTSGNTDNTNFVIRTEQQAQNALTDSGKAGGADLQAKIKSVLSSTNPSTGQPYSYLEAAQILGVDVPALRSERTLDQGGTLLPNLWREINGGGI